MVKAICHARRFLLCLATIATEHNPGDGNAPVLAEKRRRDEAAAASSAVGATRRLVD
jgi:hypothetical protein